MIFKRYLICLKSYWKWLYIINCFGSEKSSVDIFRRSLQHLLNFVVLFGMIMMTFFFVSGSFIASKIQYVCWVVKYVILWFQGTEVIASNSRSHTCLLSGVYIGNVKVLVRLSFGIDSSKEVAMKLAVRSEDGTVSDAIHEIVASG